MRILFKFPSRSRPAKFFSALDNIFSNALSTDYTVLATLDTDDATMNNDEVKARLKHYNRFVLPIYGQSESKIAAVNRDIAYAPDWDILCLHSDDMFFTKKGFDLEIINAMNQHFPDTDGMLHFPDQKAGERLCTYHIIGRKYYERSGYIYNPAYISMWCDNEEMEKAKMLGKYAFINKPILEHRHPVWGYGPKDRLLRHTERFYRRDQRIFNQRRALNFGI